MPAKVSWFTPGAIILYEISDPLTIDELERAAEEIWALAAAMHEPLDMIFDYRKVADFPRGVLPIVREGHFMLPTLDHVALVGSQPLVEMMISTLTRATFRPDPTLHPDVEEAAAALQQIANDDLNR